MQCGGNRFGIRLHGLWPDGEGKDWPQYCAATDIVPRQVIAANLCSTPSAQLLQHEWAKHGTCMPGETPASFFRRSTGMYARLRYPDMNALSRRPLPVTIGPVETSARSASPKLMPLPEAPEDARDLIFTPGPEEASPVVRWPAPKPVPTADLLAQLSRPRPAPEQPTEPVFAVVDEAEREAGADLLSSFEFHGSLSSWIGR